MKRNRLFILGIVTVLVALLSLTLVSGTFAKYTSEATLQDQAKVAKWLVKVDDNNLNTETTINVDLFAAQYAKDDTTFTGTNSVSADHKVVAPGTTGSQEFTLKNESEVAVRFTLADDSSNLNGVPLEFSTDGGTTWVTLQNAVSAKGCDIAVGGADQTFTLQWRWAFTGAESTNFTGSQTDTTDTDLGSASTLADVIVKVKIVATQIN